MTDVAVLGIKIESGQAIAATKNLDHLTKSGGRSEKSLRALGKTSVGVNSSLSKISSTARTLSGVLAGLGVSASLGSALSEFSAFEKSLIGVGKTTNILGNELQAMGRDIQGLSRILPNSATELNNIAQAAGQLGVSGRADILKFTETVARLGSASDLAGEQAATSLARILTITGESINTVDVLGSVIVRLGNNFAATESEIASAATRVAQATALFGTTASDVAAIGTALAAIGVQAEAGSTVVGRAFSVINKAVNQGGSELAVLTELTGKTGEALRDAFNANSTAAFEDFIQALGSLEKTQVSGVLADLGLEGVRVEAVLGTLATNTGVFSDALAQANDEVENTSALMTESEIALEGFGAQMDIVKNNASEFGTALGAAMAPSALSAAQAFGAVFIGLADNIDTVITAAQILATVITVKLVVGLIASKIEAAHAATAAKALAIANLESAKATATQAAAAHAGAIANLRMATAMGVGAKASTSQAAAMTAMSVAIRNNNRSMRRLGIASALTATKVGLLGRAIGFLGGPVGIIITTLATGFLLLRDNTAEASDAQLEYEAALKRTRPEAEKAVENAIDLAMARRQEAIETKIAAQALIQKASAELSARSSASAPNSPASKLELARLQDLGAAYGRLTNEIEGLIKGATDGPKKMKKLGDSLSDAGKAAVKSAKEVCGAAKKEMTCLEKVISSLEKENKEKQRTLIATEAGEEALRELNIQRTIEAELVNANVVAGSAQADQIEDLIRSQAVFTDAIADSTDALSDTDDEVGEIISKVDLLGETFNRVGADIQDSFTDMFKDMLDGSTRSFKDFGDSILDIFKTTLANMATLAIARPIIVPVIQAIGGAVGAGGAANAVAGGFGGSGGTAGGINTAASYASTASRAGSFVTGGAGFSPLQSAGVAGAAGGLIGYGVTGSTAGSIGGALGGVAGGFGGVLVASGSSGLATGAMAGTAVMPVVGTIIGAVVGALLADLVFASKDKGIRYYTQTLPDIDPNAEPRTATGYREGPFGIRSEYEYTVNAGNIPGTRSPFGLVNVSGRGIDEGAFERAFAETDELLAAFLTKVEVQEAATELQSSPVSHNLGSTFQEAEQYFIFLDRIQNVFDGVGLNNKFQELTSSIPATAAGIDELIRTTAEFLAQRDALRDTILQFGDLTPVLSVVEQSLVDIEDSADEMREAIDGMGFTGAWEAIWEGAQQATTVLKMTFASSILEGLLGFTAPLELALQKFDEFAQQRIDDATALGLRLVRIEELNGLERQAIIEQSLGVSKKDFSTSILEGILGFGDELEFSLYKFDTIAQKRLDDADLLGANINDVELLNALERQAIIEQANGNITASFESAFDNIESFISGMDLSSLSPLTPGQRFDEASADWWSTLQSANQGDVSALEAVPEAAQALLEETQAMFAGTARYTQVWGTVTDHLDRIMAREGDISRGDTPLIDPVMFDNVVSAINTLGMNDTENTQQMIDLLKEIRDGLAEMAQSDADDLAIEEAA